MKHVPFKICVLMTIFSVMFFCCGKKDQHQPAGNNPQNQISGTDKNADNQRPERPKRPYANNQPLEKPDMTDYIVSEYPGSVLLADSAQQPIRADHKGSSKSVIVYTYDTYEEVCEFYKEELKDYNPHEVTIPTGKGEQKLITFERGGRAITMMIINDEEANHVKIHYSTSGE